MSSSVFIEHNEKKTDGFEDFTSVDSDLVVVYRKNKINLDCKALENLIDEKTLSSISVVRIVSPTPSMVEEECTRRHELNCKEIDSDGASEISSSKETITEDEAKSRTHSDDGDSTEDDERNFKELERHSVSRNLKDNTKTQRYLRRKSITQNYKSEKPKEIQCTEQAEIVGLTIEAFLPGDRAKYVSREALKLAGLSAFKKSSNHDFQLYVIKNDHCYTNLSTFNQTRHKKTSDKDEECNNDKTLPPLDGGTIMAHKKLPENPKSNMDYQEILAKEIHKNENINNPACINMNRDTLSDSFVDKNKSEPMQYKDKTLTQNSDLDEHDKQSEVTGNLRKFGQQSILKHENISTHSEPFKICAFGKPVTRGVSDVTPNAKVNPTHIDQNNLKMQQVHIETSALLKSPQIKSPQNVKEIVINKITNNKFTNISLLIDPNQSLASKMHSQKNCKGFYPLAVDAEAKSSLPSQISIQTHRSSSELAAERDKQLDLIDSIVQDEMQKASIIDQTESLNENIPELVKMLENTENTLQSKEICGISNNLLNTTTVEDNGASHHSLLNQTVDDIPADLLQHVVELIEDNNTLREAVEKEVMEINKEDIANSVGTKPLSPIDSLFGKSEEYNASTLENPNANNTEIKSSLQLHTSNSDMVSTDSTQLQKMDCNNLTPNREPKKILRGNGRVIMLPPIEAPTTRAKRRAQTSPAHNPVINSSIDNSSLNVSSDVKFSPIEKKIHTTKTGPLISKDEVSVAAPGKILRKSMTKVDPTTEKEKRRESGKKNDDDDPKRLWCICRQPHNNRFMICCDLCQEWFHGTCVNVTKAMGLEMEDKKIDWTCPNCIKKQEEKKQPKITDMIPFKRNIVESNEPNHKKTVINDTTKTEETLANITEAKMPTTESKQIKTIRLPVLPFKKVENKDKVSSIKVKHTQIDNASQKDDAVRRKSQSKIKLVEIAVNKCIVCKRNAKAHSIYCSDDCIRKHAQTAINTFYTKPSEVAPINQPMKSPFEEKKKRSKESFEDVLSMPDRKLKAERVYVLERKSGRLLSGINAPTTSTIKKWLQENPTFEIVQPECSHAYGIEKKEIQQTPPIVRKPSNNSSDSFKSVPSTSAHKIDHLPQASKTKEKQLLKSEETRKNDTKFKEKIIKRATESSNKKHNESANTTDPEPIRINVRRTLKEQLLQRMKESTTPKLTADEIEEFVMETESEMYYFFNRDTGSKYKAKYRSLIFNIKDRKNHTLFTKICEKLIEPKQLIKMSPEELASQELAQWREKEAKHQLEMITKSELDLLACTQTYVLKTHKGEEEIVNKKEDCSLNSSVSLDDVVSPFDSSMTNEETVSNLLAYETYKDSNKSFETKGKSYNSETPETVERSKNVRKESENKEKERTHSEKHTKNKHHYKEKNEMSKRGRSLSKSRSRSREKRHKSSHKQERNDPKDSSHKDKKYRSESKDPRPHHYSHHSTSSSLSDKKKSEKHVGGKEKSKKEIEVFNLVDQILSSSKTVEEAANIIPEKKTDNPVSTIPPPSTAQQKSNSKPANTSSFSEFHNYFSQYATTKYKNGLWTGYINMIELDAFKTILYPLGCSENNLENGLFKNLDIVGRIENYMVWDYVYKIKKSPFKDVVLVTLAPTNEAETAAYMKFYDYLEKRKRLGVVKIPKKSHIRDFYIYPLASTSKFPEILKPLDQIDLLEETQRPNLLIGILIRTLNPEPVKEAHSSPKRRKRDSDDIDIDAIIKAPIASKMQKLNMSHKIINDTDEPYSPGGSTDDEIPLLPLKTKSNIHTTSNDALKREMDEINRQIAKQELEIAGLLNVDSSVKCFGPSSSNSSVLSKISIPSNLSQILASIKGKPEFPAASQLSQLPLAASTSAKNNSHKGGSQSVQSNDFSAMSGNKSYEKDDVRYPSRLAQLSEAELLRMVPDDIMIPPKKSHYEEPPPPGV